MLDKCHVSPLSLMNEKSTMKLIKGIDLIWFWIISLIRIDVKAFQLNIRNFNLKYGSFHNEISTK